MEHGCMEEKELQRERQQGTGAVKGELRNKGETLTGEGRVCNTLEEQGKRGENIKDI